MRGRRVLFCALLALGAAAPAAAEPTRVGASVNLERLGVEDALVLTVRVEGEGAGQAGAPSLSEARDFRRLQGPSVSTQFQWVNGRSFSSKSFTYVLQPQREGALRIPALEVEVDGRRLRTGPIEVQVVAGSLSASAGRRRPGLARPPAPGSSAAGGPQVQVEVDLDRERAYVGQQVTLVYRILTQMDITGLELVDALTYPGFWVEDLKIPPNPVGRRVVRDGEEFTELMVIKKALFPTRSGRLEIPSVTFSLGVRSSGGDPFQGLFFGTTQTLYRKSPARAVEAMPLPEQGRPASFGGAVGRYRLTVSPDRQEARVNDAIVLKVRVDGEGNVRTIAPLALPPLNDFKAYDPKVEEKSTAEGERLRGSKVWDFVLLPLAPGPQEIPALEFSFFDPEAARYQTLRSNPVRLQVARAEAELGAPSAGVAPREVLPQRADIRHLKPTPERLADATRRTAKSAGFALALVLPALANVLLGAWRFRQERLGGDPGALRRRRARRAARRALARAAALGDGASAEFYDSVARALRQYVADKLDRSAAGLTQADVERALEEAAVPPAERTRLRGCLEACDRGRFTPASARPKARLELVEQARAAVESLEARL